MNIRRISWALTTALKLNVIYRNVLGGHERIKKAFATGGRFAGEIYTQTGYQARVKGDGG